MIKTILIVTAMLFITYSNCCAPNTDELLSVVVVFRHGNKMPKQEYFDVYPNNPWMNPELWNNSDLGSVTNASKISIYERGKWLRQRYTELLPEKYSKRSVRVRSSDSDRVLASAQLLLAGLYPPKDADVWNSQLHWQPIPIHSVPETDDMILSQRVPCPRFKKMLDRHLTSRSDQLHQVEYVANHTGKAIKSLDDVYKLYKLLRIVEENGLTLPKWAIEAMPLLKQQSELVFTTYSLTKEMQRLVSGPFFHTVLKHFDTVLSKPDRGPKMLLLAAHARTIANALMALDAYKEQPPYSSALMFELRKDCKGVVRLSCYYQTAAKGAPSEILKDEPYKSFKARLKRIAVDPETWHRECKSWSMFGGGD
ncbi:hypothetical protein NQ315_000177 [Exocentrus adspersus]|uniref:acid phosphatase n=1 Tax=Exocentrus adspersus TaxID=1586481 RepID=A0AAV8VRN4_9CUCU|nr:hypothetical protein NQ315_000177 [Exocentrus adspersus]